MLFLWPVKTQGSTRKRRESRQDHDAVVSEIWARRYFNADGSQVVGTRVGVLWISIVGNGSLIAFCWRYFGIPATV